MSAAAHSATLRNRTKTSIASVRRKGFARAIWGVGSGSIGLDNGIAEFFVADQRYEKQRRNCRSLSALPSCVRTNGMIIVRQRRKFKGVGRRPAVRTTNGKSRSLASLPSRVRASGMTIRCSGRKTGGRHSARYSERRAWMMSTRAAREAGRIEAITAAASSTKAETSTGKAPGICRSPK